jgi:hypothetical protein
MTCSLQATNQAAEYTDYTDPCAASLRRGPTGHAVEGTTGPVDPPRGRAAVSGAARVIRGF